jgi:sugar phosphate isomerase/epimerase
VLNEQKIENVGIVYNFHHGHAHIQNFKALLETMKPKLLAINLNGMELEGDKKGKKIYPVGKGDQELAMLKTLKDSGWQGPVGIICHRTDADAEVVLKENLEGLNRLRNELAK